MTPEELAAQETQIRQLAAQITQMSKLGYEPLTIRKGVVAAVADTENPPTVSVNLSGDATTLVAGVRTLNNYTPLVGQTVLIGKQGTEIFLLGAISSMNPAAKIATTTDSGWIKADLSNGSHNGNSNGDIYYRRVLDHGSWKMQWQGGWTVSGTAMIDTAKALETDYRPTAHRSILAARQTSGGAVSVQFDFHTDGRVIMTGSTAGVTTSGNGGGFGTDVRLSGYLSQAGSDLGHSHIVNNDHTHTAAPTAPGWVSLNGVEYFL